MSQAESPIKIKVDTEYLEHQSDVADKKYLTPGSVKHGLTSIIIITSIFLKKFMLIIYNE